MQHKSLLAKFSLIAAAAMLFSACAPAAAGVTQVVVTSPPIEITKIVAGTSETVIITATPGATAVPDATALPAGSITLNVGTLKTQAGPEGAAFLVE